MVTQHMQQVQTLNPHQARAQFLGKISVTSDARGLVYDPAVRRRPACWTCVEKMADINSPGLGMLT